MSASKEDSVDQEQAVLCIEALGGKENIAEVTNCATRLRVSVYDESKVEPDSVFKSFGAHGVVRNGKALQIIIGLSVPRFAKGWKSC